MSVQQVIHMDHCQAPLAAALDNFNTFLPGFLVARGCEKLHKELGRPQDQQTWDDWLDCIPNEMLEIMKIPLDMKKVWGQTAQVQAAETHNRYA